MYAGSTLTPFSGRIIGAHQKIDRVARRHLKQLAPHCYFPTTKSILHFEGSKGPDAIKRKSPAQNEPWHYMLPFDITDTQLIGLIESHYRRLVSALTCHDTIRASFEAAWLSHAVVDGLTPAHQYPYEQELTQLRGGESNDTRDTILKKLLLPGTTLTHQMKNNWRMWGPRGLITTHFLFEWGIAVMMAPSYTKWKSPSAANLQDFTNLSIGQWYRDIAQDIARMGLYEDYSRTGWTISIARRARNILAPKLIQAVCTIWYGAVQDANAARTIATNQLQTNKAA